MEITVPQIPQYDHDLLIRIDQKVADLTMKVDNLNNTAIKEIADLKVTKADQSDLTILKADGDKAHDNFGKAIRLINEVTIPNIRQRMAYWAGGIAVGTFIIGMVVSYFINRGF